MSYRAIGRHDRAFDELSKAIETNATFGPAYYSRAVTHCRIGSVDPALADF